jgi:hypothetical protein
MGISKLMLTGPISLRAFPTPAPGVAPAPPPPPPTLPLAMPLLLLLLLLLPLPPAKVICKGWARKRKEDWEVTQESGSLLAFRRVP